MGNQDPFTINPREHWAVLDAVAGIVLSQLPFPVVEIGSSYGDAVTGKSCNILKERAKHADVWYYSCDIRRHCVTDYPKHLHQAVSSFSFMEWFATADITPALVFLDGCHDYEVVMQEVKFFLRMLHTHGVILLHDTYPKKEENLARNRCSDSYRVRQELERWTDVVDCFTWPYTAGGVGLTMVLKKAEDRPYFRR